MFFFQDDVGILIQLAATPIWQLVLAPQAEHFVPVFKLFSLVQYKMFALNFPLYVYSAYLIHLLNCFLLYKIANYLFKQRIFALTAVAVFSINITYIEPFFWWAAQGELLAMFFLACAFFFWLNFMERKSQKSLFISVPLLLFAGYSYGVGVGAGIVFALISYIYKGILARSLLVKTMLFFLLTGGISYLGGLLVAVHKPLPQLVSLMDYFVRFITFVAAGVARGVVGRVFFPGFDPRHFEIFPTVISFIPFLIFIFLLISMFRNIRTEGKRKMLVILVLMVYPYLWAGVLRAQFGLKQALAERYAYVSLFFFALLFSFLILRLRQLRLLRSKRILVLFLTTILILQSAVFFLKAKDFEVRPKLTKLFFENISQVFAKSEVVINLPLPSYINQPYKNADLAPVLAKHKQFIYLEVEDFVCDNTMQGYLTDIFLYQFYLLQSKDKRARHAEFTYEFRKCHQESLRLK